MGAGSLLYQWALSGTRKHSWWLYNFTNVLNTTELCTLVNFQIRSVAQPCPTLCDPMNRSRPGLAVHHQLPEFTETHVHQWYHSTISSSVIPFSSCPQSLPASESFPMSQLFAWGGQSISVSALASVLPMNTQDWSPLGWHHAKLSHLILTTILWGRLHLFSFYRWGNQITEQLINLLKIISIEK